MISAPPNPFIDSLSAVVTPADQLTARDDCAAVLSFPESPQGACQEAAASTGQASAAASTSDNSFPYRFGRKPSSRQAWIDAICLRVVENAIDPLPMFLRDHVTPQHLARDAAHQHRDCVEDQDRLDHLVGHRRSPSTSPNTITGINAHEQ